MPTITRTIGRFDLESIDHDSWSSRGSKAWVLNLEEIMDGSTITAARLDISVDVSNPNSSALLWLGSAPSSGSGGKKISITNARSSSYNVLSLFSGKTTFSASDKVTFTYQVNANNSKGSGTGHFGGYTTGSTIVLTLTYVEPYTACTPPTTLTMAKATSGPSETVRLSWSGAQAGTNNPIASYTVYRSTDNSTWEVLQSGIENEYLDVTAPGTNGSTYYYSVVAVGTVAGYDSAKSTSVSLKCSYTAPTVSNVLLDAGSVTIYKPAGSTAVLSWTGTAGTNNPIARYAVYRNGTLLQDVTGATSLTVDVPAAGGNYYFNVVAVGAYSNSASVTSPTVYAYSDPSAPSAVALAKAECGKGETVRLSWSGAVAGAQNAITGYRVYRSTSEDGTYSQLGEDIASTDTSGYLDVVSDTRKGRSYYYKVVTIGAHSASAMSSAVSLKTVWTAPTVTSISLSADTVAPGAGSELRFAVADGTNNPVTAIEVYQGTTKLATLGASAASYAVTAGSEAGDQLSFTVKPIGTVEDGEASSAVVLKSYGHVSAPASVTVSNSTPDAGTNVVLSWAASADGTFNPVQSYQVYRASASGGPFTALGSPVTGTSLSVTAPSVMGNAYYYVVVAKGQFTDSGYSSAVAVTAKVYTVPTAPTASVSPSVCGIGDSPVLSWSGAQAGTNNPITGYRVFRSTSETGTFTQLGADLAANVSSLTVDQPPTMGASYYYRVYAIGTKAGFLLSDASNTVQLTRKVYSKCGTPSVSISAELANPGSTVTISWNASADGTNNPVTGYKIFKNSGSGYALYQTVGVNVLSVTDTVAASGTTQRYYVQAVSAFDGFSSDNSAVVTVVSNTAPSAVVLTVQPDQYYESGNQHFEWRASSDPDGGTIYYDIQYAYLTSDGSFEIWSPWEDIPSITATQFDYNTWQQKTPPRGKAFMFRFRSRDALGLTSAWTNSNRFIMNSLPIAPTIVYPADSNTIYDVQPYIVIDVSADPDGHAQYIDLSIDQQGFNEALFLNKRTGRMAVRCGEALSYGEHTIYVRTRDELGAASSGEALTVNIVDPAWARTIERGTVISKLTNTVKASSSSYAMANFYDALEAKPVRIACSVSPKVTYDLSNIDPFAPGSGRNKLYFPHNENNRTSSGLTMKYSNGGYYLFEGTVTSVARFTLVSSKPVPNGNYYLYCTISSYADKISLSFRANSGDSAIDVESNTRYPVTITNGLVYSLSLTVPKFTTSRIGFTIRAMLLEEDDESNEFVPYANIGDFDETFILGIQTSYMATSTIRNSKRLVSIPVGATIGSNGYGFGVVYNEDGTGVISVTHGHIASYAGESLPAKWYSSYDKYVAGRLPSLGAEVVYPLDTPIEYPFSDVSSDNLYALENGVYASNAKKMEVTYRTNNLHQLEVEQLYALVNASRAYYNLSPVSVPASVGEDYANAGAGKIGMFAAWGSQMLALYNALKDIFTLIGVSAPTLTITAGMPPTASIINTIRTMIESA